MPPTIVALEPITALPVDQAFESACAAPDESDDNTTSNASASSSAEHAT